MLPLLQLVFSLEFALELWFWVWLLSFKILLVDRRHFPFQVWIAPSWALLSFWLELAWQQEQLLVASFPARHVTSPHGSPVPQLSSLSPLK